MAKKGRQSRTLHETRATSEVGGIRVGSRVIPRAKKNGYPAIVTKAIDSHEWKLTFEDGVERDGNIFTSKQLTILRCEESNGKREEDPLPRIDEKLPAKPNRRVAKKEKKVKDRLDTKKGFYHKPTEIIDETGDESLVRCAAGRKCIMGNKDESKTQHTCLLAERRYMEHMEKSQMCLRV